MSELSNKIRALRGKKTAEEAAKICKLSRESFYRCERGGSVKYITLKQIARGFQLNENDWLALLIAWLKTEAGDDLSKLYIESKSSSPLHDADHNQVAQAMISYERLNPTERIEVLKAMQRKEVVACLPAINRIWDKLTNETA